MDRFDTKLILAAVLSAALVGGCGGGGGGGGETAPGLGQSATTALLAFMNSLIAGTDETSEPIDTTALTLAVDDKAEPDSL